MQLTKGTSIAGYQILDKIGSGGMGDVYRARQESLDRLVALKVLPPELSRNREFAERFASEAKLISRLEHHNIVTIFDFGEANGNRFFAMQYVEGESLDQRIQREKRLGVEEALEISRQILRALKYAHEHSVIHRDIKPHNVLIDRKGKIFVSDFGIAKLFAHTRITNTGMTVGTPEYMSPEQAEGRKLDAQTDIYSLGIVMYEMLVGLPPFTGESPLSVAYKQVNENPRPPYDYNDSIPQRVGLIVLKALKKDKAQRYQTAAEMLEDLDLAIENDRIAKEKLIVAPSAVAPSGSTVILERRLTDRRMGDRRRGDRRGFRDQKDVVRKILLPAILICGAALCFLWYYFFTHPQNESKIRSFKISATSCVTSVGNEKSGIANLTDENPATAWAEGTRGPGFEEYVLFTFRRPMNLSRIGIWSGFCGQQENGKRALWLQYNRLKEAEVSLSNGERRILKFSDRPDGQFFILPMHKTTSLRLAILGIYPGTATDTTCISEIEIWGMKAR